MVSLVGWVRRMPRWRKKEEAIHRGIYDLSELRWKRKSGGNLYQQVSMNDRLEKKRWMMREWKNLIHFIFE